MMVFSGTIKRRDILKYLDKELDRLHDLIPAVKSNSHSANELWSQIKKLEDTLNKISLRSSGLEY